MPTAEAQLILSCKATGQKEIEKFNKSVILLDKNAEKLNRTIDDLQKSLSKISPSGMGKMNPANFLPGMGTTGKIGQLYDESRLKRFSDIAKQMQDSMDNALSGISGKSSTASKGMENIAISGKKAAGATKDLSAAMIAARAAGKAFGFELSGLTKNMAYLQIISAGVDGLKKSVKEIYRYFDEIELENIGWAKSNAEETERMISEWKKSTDQIEKNISTIKMLNDIEKLSSVNKYEMQRAVKSLSESLKGYEIIIDSTTGKVKNLSDIEIAFSESKKNKGIENIKQQLKDLNEQRDLLRKRADVSFWDDLVTGGSASREAIKAAEETVKLANRERELKIQLKEFEKLNPAEDIRNREAAKQADLLAKQKAEADRITKAFSDQIAAMREKVKFQDLINNGFSEEAKKLSAISELEKKFPKFSKDQIQQLYNESKKLDDLIAKQNEITEAKRQAEIAAKEQQRNAEQLARKAEQERSARAAITQELVKAGQQYKQMARMAIDANSAEGILMQSRKLFNTGFQNLQNFQPQQNQKVNIAQMVTSPAGINRNQSSLQNQVQRMNKIENILEKIVTLIESGNGTRDEIKNSFSGTTSYN